MQFFLEGDFKEMKKHYSKWSAILSVICAVTIFVSYAVEKEVVLVQ